MPEIGEDEIRGIMDKYKNKLETQLGSDDGMEKEGLVSAKPVTREYLQFKEQYLPAHMGIYEKMCAFAEKTLKIKPDEKSAEEYQHNIDTCHLNVTPTGVQSFALMTPIIAAFIGILMTFVLFQGSMFMIAIFVGTAMGFYKPLKKIPEFMANQWRMKASGQMVMSIFYVVTYMRHTSNLELAIEFASKHLAPPMSLDLRRVLWNVENETYESVSASLDAYLAGWKKYNLEYIEAMHLIQGSLMESSDERRVTMLDKSLGVMLEGTYEKMLHYAQNLQAPLTSLHMLGIILPILGLVILPLMVSFMDGVQWFHISALYNMLLPMVVFYMGKNILATRPSGYGHSDSNDAEKPEVKIRVGGADVVVDPLKLSIMVGVVLALIGFSPIILNMVGVGDFGFGAPDEISSCAQKFCLLDYKPSQKNSDVIIGPFGLGASVLSVFVIMGLGLSIGLYYRLQAKNVIEIREKSKKLEQEFASALFQLANRLGDGVPAEMAFGRVAETMDGTISGSFFAAVSNNVERMGMSVEQAIFNKKNGALKLFPSDIIESSMKVLVESAKKGPMIAAQALINISEYIKQMHAVDERLKDLMSETISGMKSQVKFMTPVISGIVIGITSMITTIMGKISTQMANVSKSTGGGADAPVSLTEMFQDGLPTFYFQIVVGLYVVQLCYILTVITNGIENGADETGEKYSLGQNVTRGTILYSLLSIAVIIAFNVVASSLL